MTDVDPGITCRSLSFRYGRRPALAEVSFSVGRGVCGVLGPNGAGKSTLLGLCATILRPDGGTVEVAGHDLASARGRDRVRRSVGYLPQRFSVMAGASVLRNVAYAAWANGVDGRNCESAAGEALALVGLAGREEDRAGTLSGGQRQRLGLACAVAHRPAVLLLDEPTVGIDPVQRVTVRYHLDLIGREAAVLVSTHLVEDLAQIASRVLVLDRGRLAFDGSVAGLEERGADTGPFSTRLEAGYAGLLQPEQR